MEMYHKTFVYKILHPEEINTDKIRKWFTIQGFTPFTFMLEKDEIVILIS